MTHTWAKTTFVLALLLAATGCTSSDEVVGDADGWQIGGGDIGAADVARDAATPDDVAPDIPDVAPDVAPDVEPDVAPPDVGRDADAGECNADVTNDDCDYDGLLDCEERLLGTEKCNHDTDGDGLSDGLEVIHGTDPLDPDTDGDGAEDGHEFDLDLDPTRQDTYGDGVNDGDRWAVSACDNPQPNNFQIYTNGGTGDWVLTLPETYTDYRRLVIATSTPDNHQAAAVYSNPSAEISGFLLSAAATPNQQPVEALAQRRQALELMGNITDEFTTNTWSNFAEAPLGRYVVETHRALTPNELRDALLVGMAPFSRTDASGFAPTNGPASDTFRVFISTFERPLVSGANQQLTLVAVAPQTVWQSDSQVEFAMANLTDRGAVRDTSMNHDVRCKVFAPRNPAMADFYWVIDNHQVVQMDGTAVNASARVYDAITSFSDTLDNTRLDMRHALAPMDEAYQGLPRAGVGWHSSPYTLESEFGALLNLTGASAQTHGLQEARDGIEFIKELGGNVPAESLAVRKEAELFTIFVTDEAPASLDGLDNAQRTQLMRDYGVFFGRHSTVMAVVADGNTCGVADGAAYREVAHMTQGASTSLCVDDMAATLEQAAERAALNATTYDLGWEDPVPSSIRVFVDGRPAPRSRENGWDLLPGTGKIAFFGDYRPKKQVNAVPEHVAVIYERTLLPRY